MVKTSSSSTYSMYFNCPFSKYLCTVLNLVGESGSLHTLFGTGSHDSVEDLCKGSDLDHAIALGLESIRLIGGTTPDEYPRSQELTWLHYGLIRSFAEYHLPVLQERYEITAIEQEYVIPLPTADHPTVHYMTRPDLVLRDRTTGKLFNGPIKTSGYMKDLDKIFEYSMQMLMEAHAIRVHAGYDTGGSVMIALSKGRKGRFTKADIEAKKTGWRMESPFTYVWWKNDTYSFQASKGAVKRPVWEFNESPAEWYEKVPPALKQEQCHISEPIDHTVKVPMSELIEDIIYVETQEHWPRNRDSCNNYGGFNRPCEYKAWCYGTPAQRETQYTPRIPNHPHESRILDIQKDF